MKAIIFILLLLSVISFGQKKVKIPSKAQKSVALLAPYLTNGLITDKDMADTIYSWITHTIEYDYKKISSGKPFKEETSAEALKKKTATCTGYCELLKDMLAVVDIESEVVHGYMRSDLTDSIIIPTFDTHAWVAVKLNKTWYLTDPTWDAGYIGSIPTNKKIKYKKKWRKLDAKFKKKPNKKKQEKAEEKLSRKERMAKDFTGKIGFVNQPDTAWYLTNVDTFLSVHLPSNPMWQLKYDTISLLTFAQGKDSIYSYTSKHYGNSYPFEQEIAKYQELDVLERMIYTAEDAFMYNPKNSHIKAINYFNFVNIISNKKVQKVVPQKYKIYDYTKLLPFVDTTSVYTKLAVKEEKIRYNYERKCYAALYKKENKTNKGLVRTVKKGVKYNKLALKKAASKIKKQKTEAVSMMKKIEKLEETTNTNSTDTDVKIKQVIQFKDSLNTYGADFDEKFAIWDTLRKHTYLQSLANSLLHNRYLINMRKKYLGYNSYKVNKYIASIDSTIDSNNVKIAEIYLDSIPVEMLEKDLFNNIKSMTANVMLAKTELKKLKADGAIKSIDIEMNRFNRILIKYYDKMLEVNKIAIGHNMWMEGVFKQFQGYWNEIDGTVEFQETLIKGRYEHAKEEIKNEHLRETTMFKSMGKIAQNWKKKFK